MLSTRLWVPGPLAGKSKQQHNRDGRGSTVEDLELVYGINLGTLNKLGFDTKDGRTCALSSACLGGRPDSPSEKLYIGVNCLPAGSFCGTVGCACNKQEGGERSGWI